MFGSHHRRRAVVVLRKMIDNEPLLFEVLCHRGARIRSGMLDIWPIDVSSREFKVGFDRLARVLRAANDQTADDKHLVSMQGSDGFKGGVASLMAIFTL